MEAEIVKFKNAGFNAHRLRKEEGGYYDKEINFVKSMNINIDHNQHTLDDLTGVYKMEKRFLTESERKVAMSVIQWLGTPVGQCFIDEVSKMPKP